MKTQDETYRVRVTYSSGKTVEIDGWSDEMVARLRMSWRMIAPPASGTVERVRPQDTTTA